MSKYDPLWMHVSSSDGDSLLMSYCEIESVLGFPVNHSFLNAKKDLLPYGWQVKKISLKAQTVLFSRL